MPVKRAETERRLRLMAKAKADMLFGTYVWPDGRSPLLPDGSPRVSHKELLRLADYSATYKDYMTTLFSDPYFEKQLRLEVARREKVLLPTLANRGAIRRVRDLFVSDLETRLREDASSFSNVQVISAIKELSSLIADDEREERLPPGDKTHSFNTFFTQQNINVMNQSEREHLASTASDAADRRLDHLQQVIEMANVLEADADDVTDAADSPEQG